MEKSRLVMKLETALRFYIDEIGIDIKKVDRHYDVVVPRQAFMTAARIVFKEASFKDIGRLLDKDHSTVIHSVNKFTETIGLKHYASEMANKYYDIAYRILDDVYNVPIEENQPQSIRKNVELQARIIDIQKSMNKQALKVQSQDKLIRALNTEINSITSQVKYYKDKYETLKMKRVDPEVERLKELRKEYLV